MFIFRRPLAASLAALVTSLLMIALECLISLATH
jgi:hypothetical protein